MNEGPPAVLFNNTRRSVLQNDVSLHLMFATHGAEKRHPGIGFYATSVEDADYANVERFINHLDPTRNDALAIEEYKYIGTGPRTRAEMEMEMRYEARRTGIIDVPDPFDYSELLRRQRAVRMINVFRYAERLSVGKGIATHPADADFDHVRDFRRMYPQTWYEKAYPVTFGKPEMDMREFHMVKRLGEIGLSVALGDPHLGTRRPALVRKPILGFIAGSHHYPGVTKLLDEQEIPYKAELFSGQEYTDYDAMRHDQNRKHAGQMFRDLTGRSRKRELLREVRRRNRAQQRHQTER